MSTTTTPYPKQTSSVSADNIQIDRRSNLSYEELKKNIYLRESLLSLRMPLQNGKHQTGRRNGSKKLTRTK